MSRELTYVGALREALFQAMEADPSVLMIGENIRGEIRPETRGLHARFGDSRVLDMPISEAAFTGFATGAALAGGRIIVEFQVSSLIFPAFDQLVNQAAKLPYMLGGQRFLPVTYLIMGAGAGGGRAGQHSDNPYPYLLHAGIKTVFPTTPGDAKSLMLAAIAEDDPVAVFAPVGAYGTSGDVPEAPVVATLGQGVVRHPGTDVTVVAGGPHALQAVALAENMSSAGISVEVWDPLSLLPLDKAGLEASVNKTGRLVVFDDSNRTCGFAAEIAGLVAERCFHALKAPIKRVTRADVVVPYSASIEAEVLGTVVRLETAIRAVAAVG
jgi:acetoin:2,6-dichlorophenolindophenol oxidoreductase subunit beta